MTDKTDTAAAPAAEQKPVAIDFTDPAKRTKSIPLAHPVSFGGKAIEAINLRRMTQGEVAALIEQSAGKDGPVRFPLFCDFPDGKIPEELFRALDDDDAFTIDAAAADFLPRRFRPD